MIQKDMTIKDIQDLIFGDEDRVLELKKSTGELKDGMKSACAFLNTDERQTNHCGYLQP